MLEQFLKEAIPDAVTCLGVRLRPFSRGHYWLMNKWRSPFVTGGRAGLKDLLLAVLICSNDYNGAQAVLSDPDLGKDLRTWENKLFGRFIRKKGVAERILKAHELMRDHVRRGLAEPYVAVNRKPSAEIIGSDFSMLSVAASMRVFGQSFDEAINQYMPLARWLLAINSEREGTLRICDRLEMENLQREADAIAAEIEKEENE